MKHYYIANVIPKYSKYFNFFLPFFLFFLLTFYMTVHCCKESYVYGVFVILSLFWRLSRCYFNQQMAHFDYHTIPISCLAGIS